MPVERWKTGTRRRNKRKPNRNSTRDSQFNAIAIMQRSEINQSSMPSHLGQRTILDFSLRYRHIMKMGQHSVGLTKQRDEGDFQRGFFFLNGWPMNVIVQCLIRIWEAVYRIYDRDSLMGTLAIYGYFVYTLCYDFRWQQCSNVLVKRVSTIPDVRKDSSEWFYWYTLLSIYATSSGRRRWHRNK